MRSIPLAVLLVLGASTAHADVPAILACADVSDGQARLQCYDREAAKLKTDMVEAQQRKFSLFGFTLFGGGNGQQSEAQPDEPVLGPKEISQIEAKLDDWFKDGTGHVTVSLDNGQVWHVEDVSNVPTFQKKGEPIVIARNIMGGYYMSINGRDTRLTVTRVR
jgi:hypothetical protein